MRRLLFTFPLVCLLLLACCAPVRHVVPAGVVNRTDRDTVQVHDSIYVSRWVLQRGDTVFVCDTLWRTRYRDRVREVTRIDSIPYPVEVETRVPYVPPFYRWCTGLFIGAIVLLILLTALRFRHRL